jgi:hypothetical protein
MSVQELEQLQQDLAPKEDLTPHVGRWVALREGHVIAVADDPAELRASRDVGENDVILLVPRNPGGYFL